MSKSINEYRNVAIVSALPIELEYVDEFLIDRQGWKKLSDNKYQFKDRVTLHTRIVGAGKVNSAFQTAELIKDETPELVVNVGYAGGLAKGARKGDVVIGTDYTQVDFEPLAKVSLPEAETPKQLISDLEDKAEELGIPYHVGRIATGDFFLHKEEDRKNIISKYDPVAFDMESAAIAQVAAVREFDFAVLRTFSDLADDNALDSILDNRIEAENNTRIPIEQRPIVLFISALEA